MDIQARYISRLYNQYIYRLRVVKRAISVFRESIGLWIQVWVEERLSQGDFPNYDAGSPRFVWNDSHRL